MKLNHKTEAYLAIEIGGTKLQWMVCSADAQILKRGRLKIDKAKGAEGIQAQLIACVKEVQQDFAILRTGVGFGGPVNRGSGVIGESHQIEGWTGFPLAEWLETQTQTSVYIENDANTAALGEAVYGAGRGYRTVFYVTLGSGIGGGLVQDGQLYYGREQGESEIGHLRIDKSGTILEQACSGWAVDLKVRDAIVLHPQSLLATTVPHSETGGEARFLLPAIQRGCPVALEILDDVTATLALAASHVIHLLNPDVLIFGGGLSLLGEPLREGISNKLPQFVMKAFAPMPTIALAGLGEDVVPMGALAMILSKSENNINV